MALEPIIIRIEGQNNARDAVREATQDVKGLGAEADKSGEKLQRFNKNGRAIDDNGKFVKMGRDIKGVGDEASRLPGAFDKAESAMDRLTNKTDEFRRKGLEVAMVGGAGLLLTKSFADAAAEGQGMQARLESILTAQGRLADMEGLNASIQDVTVRGSFDDDDSLRDATVKLLSFNTQTKDTGELLELAARQARTMGTEVGSVAEALGKAYNTGAVGALKKSGVTIDDADIDKIKEAYAISKELGQQTFMDTLGPAIKASTASIETSLTAQQKSINDSKRAYDDFATAVGVGSQLAEGQMRNMTASVIGLVSQNPQLAAGAGYVLAWGSAGLVAAGGLINAGAQLVVLTNGIIAFRAQRAAQAATEAAATAATTTNTVATAANTGATGTNTASKTANAAATTASGNAAVGAAAKVGILSTAMSLGGMAAAGIGLAVGTAMAAAVYWAGQATGALDKHKSMLDAVSDGWNALKDSFTGGNSAAFGATQRDLESGIKQVEADASAAVIKGTKTQDKANEDAVKAKLELYDDYAREQLRTGDTANMVANQQKAAQLRQQMQGPVALAPPPMPATAPTVAVPTAGDTAPDEGAVTALEDQITRESDKDKKKELQIQLRHMKDAVAEAKRTTAAKKKEADAEKKLADKATDAAEALANDRERRSAELMKLDVSDKASDAISALQDKLDAATEAKDTARIKVLTTQIGIAKAQEELSKALLDASIEDDKEQKKFLEESARKKFNMAVKEAKRDGAKAGESTTKGDDKGKRDAATRAALASMRAAASPASFGFAALNPGANVGDRFAGLSPSLFQPVAASGGMGAGSGSGSGAQGRHGPVKVGAPSYSQDANGDTMVQFPPVRVPYQGIAGLGDSR